MDALRQDLRIALRQLRRSPAFTLVAVLTLALGIGVNTVVFSLVNALLLRPVGGVEEPDRVAALYTAWQGGSPGVNSYMDYVDFRDQVGAFAGLAAFKHVDADLLRDGRSVRLHPLLVTHAYFDVLGVRPALGRFFHAEEDVLGHPRTVAVLSHSFWREALGGDPGVIGRSLILNGREFSVVGVAASGFSGTTLGFAPELFVPMAQQPHFMPGEGNLLPRRGWGGIDVIGRLAHGASLEGAQAEIDVVAGRLAVEYPQTNEPRSYKLVPFREATLPPGVRGELVTMSAILLGLVGLVLLVACVNVANLLLARGARRRRELAVRQALGAGRGRLCRQLLVESALLALLGGAAAVLLASLAASLLQTLPLPIRVDASPDGRVLAFALAASGLAALAFGLLPAVRGTRLELTRDLKGRSGLSGGGAARGEGGLRRWRLSDLLVTGQVAACLVLLFVAGLCVRTLENLREADVGFATTDVLVAQLHPALQGYGGERLRAFYGEAAERIAALPGVRAATLASNLPGPGGDFFTVRLEGAPEDEPLSLGVASVAAGYFRALGIPLLRGRELEAADIESAPPVVVVNRAAARRIETLTEADPLGAVLRIGGPQDPGARVVGIVENTRMGSLREDPAPMFYAPLAQMPTDGLIAQLHLLVRTAGPPEALAPTLRDAVAAVDPRVPLTGLTSLDRRLGESLAGERVVAVLLAGAAGLALLLASLGLYGLLAYAVSLRVPELGLRMALGARGLDLVRQVVSRGLLLTGIGSALGILGALAAARPLSGFFYGVRPSDPLTLVGAAVLLALVAALASWLPARRAARVDPMIALRAE